MPQQQISPQQLNALARSAIMSQAVEMTQVISTQTLTPSQTPVITILNRNVGLIKGFYIEVTATVINNDGANAITPTDFNVANLFSNIYMTDLQNNVRINTPGWHLEMINSIKSKRVFGTAFVNGTGIDTPIKYGSNWNVISCPSTIAHGATGTLKMVYWIPCAYSDADYRGAIYANVVNASMNLQLTVNPTPGVATGTDTTSAIFVGSATVAISSMTVTVSQVYMDQLPVGQGGVILPLLDLSTIYELKQTTVVGMVANQDFPTNYANYRDFLSTVAVYNNNGTTRGVGADINSWALQSANFTNIFKMDPYLAALRTRNILGQDMPAGAYYFSHRNRPISTVQYGNMQLVLNPITAGGSAYMLLGFEDFAFQNTLTGAGSLPAS